MSGEVGNAGPVEGNLSTAASGLPGPAPSTMDWDALCSAAKSAEQAADMQDIGEYGYGGEVFSKYEVMNWSDVAEASAQTFLRELCRGSVISQFTFNASDDPGYATLRHVEVVLVANPERTESWAIRWMGRCLGRHGSLDYEPTPSSRSEGWLGEFRFPKLVPALIAGRALADALLAWIPNQGPMPTRVEVIWDA